MAKAKRSGRAAKRSVRAAKRSGRVASESGRKTASAHYLYCIGLWDELTSHLGAAMPDPLEPNGGLELIRAEPDAKASPAVLAAVASTVPLPQYAQRRLEAKVTDPAWMATRAMRHENVVQYFASAASVIPLRFGAIYLDRVRVRKMLQARRKELLAVIEKLKGREEWGVNVYCDESKLRASVLNASRKAGELRKEAEGGTPGQAYLARKQFDSMGIEKSRLEIGRLLNVIEVRLQGVSEAAKRLRVLKTESGDHGKLVGRFAFLVPRNEFARFQAAAKGLLKSCQPAGLSLELTGPWPAYNFVQP